MRASTDELVTEARSAIRSVRWERFEAGATIIHDDDWTPCGLLDALNQLMAEIDEEDSRRGLEGGPGSYKFQFYDVGLACLTEVLRDRVRNEPRRRS